MRAARVSFYLNYSYNRPIMAFSFSNKQIADLLRNVAAVYQIKNKNQFQIRAYDLAADSIEHSTSDIKTLWEEGQLDSVPGLGDKIRGYLDELFREGKVKHFDEVFVGIHKSIFEFLKIPGIGPKTAQKLSVAGVKSVDDLEGKIKTGKLLKNDFSEKILQKILQGIGEYKRKSDRILLPIAQEAAKELIEYLKDFSKVKRADTLGSLRRMVATVGDIDLSVASEDPEAVIKHFCNYSGVERVIEFGERTATVLLKIGQRVDLMVQPPESYGNLLQHLTGSKNHNIKLRSLARDQGLSMSEYGISELATNKNHKFEKEEKVYEKIGLEYVEPELREDTGEIESAKEHNLPSLIKIDDIKGDLHTHTFWTDGKNSVSEMAQKAIELNREYIALTDHSYPTLQYDKRNNQIEQYNYSQSKIRVIKGLEVNINVDATLQIPDEILAKHELNWVSIHTSFRQSEKEMTGRLIKALENKFVTGLAHPTGRLLLEREGIEADWGKIFKFAADNGKIMEINAFPNRTDLPDLLIREAKKYKVKFSIDTDSHSTDHLWLMEYGIANARRGWVEKKEVINTLPYTKLKNIITLQN